jgi:hypothetical protein
MTFRPADSLRFCVLHTRQRQPGLAAANQKINEQEDCYE